jgi:uncharacterized YkwD family protein
MKRRISWNRKVKPAASRTTSPKRSVKTPVRRASGLKPRIKQSNAFELQVFRLVNMERTSRGIPALTLNSTLAELARLKSTDMRDNNYFGHNSPLYGSPQQMLDRFGVEWRASAENIAAGPTTPEEVVRVWMNSTGHRANILDRRFTDTGVGYVAGNPTSEYRTYWTQLFIQRP